MKSLLPLLGKCQMAPASCVKTPLHEGGVTDLLMDRYCAVMVVFLGNVNKENTVAQ